MKKYFLEEIKNFTLQIISFIALSASVIVFIALLANYPILLLPSLLLGLLYGLWQSAKRKYQYNREVDRKYVSNLFSEVYHIAVIYKQVEKNGFNLFKKSFQEYCKKYPEDKETIETFTEYYQDLKKIFKSLKVEVE